MRIYYCIRHSRKFSLAPFKSSPTYCPQKALIFSFSYGISLLPISLGVSVPLPLSVICLFSFRLYFWDSFIPVAVSAICFFLLSSIPWICQIPHCAIIRLSILLHFFSIFIISWIYLRKNTGTRVLNMGINASSLRVPKVPRGPAVWFLSWCYENVGRE